MKTPLLTYSFTTAMFILLMGIIPNNSFGMEHDLNASTTVRRKVRAPKPPTQKLQNIPLARQLLTIGIERFDSQEYQKAACNFANITQDYPHSHEAVRAHAYQGNLYLWGTGVERNYKKALTKFQFTAHQEECPDLYPYALSGLTTLANVCNDQAIAIAAQLAIKDMDRMSRGQQPVKMIEKI